MNQLNSNKPVNSLWDKDEFEEIIIKGIMAMYDIGKNKTPKFKLHPSCRVKKQDVSFMRKVGCYFSPWDRWSPTFIDVRNDGLVNSASLIMQEDNSHLPESDWNHGYATLRFAKRLKNVPSKYKKESWMDCFYEMISVAALPKGGARMVKDIIAVHINNDGDGICIPLTPSNSTSLMDKEMIEKIHIALTTCISLSQDRRHLWNVTAKEGIAKTIFGVYQEQIKSLFYARDLPISKTGRKRPILHWVESHKRRLRNGTDIEIESHLRGVTKFEMGGTDFEITRPIKKA